VLDGVLDSRLKEDLDAIRLPRRRASPEEVRVFRPDRAIERER
jgi:hypothetical protein